MHWAPPTAWCPTHRPGKRTDVPRLRQAARTGGDLVREHAEWAIGRIAQREAAKGGAGSGGGEGEGGLGSLGSLGAVKGAAPD